MRDTRPRPGAGPRRRSAWRRWSRLGALALSLLGCDEEHDPFADVDAGTAALVDRALAAAALDRAATRGKDPAVEVAVLHGRVHRILFHRAPALSSLGWVSALDGLTTLHIRGGQLQRLDGLAAPCSLEELRLERTGTRSLAPLKACPALVKLVLVDLPLEGLATLPPLPRLEELHVERVTMPRMAALSGSPHLRVLTVRHAGLTSLAGVGPLPRLEKLDVSHNQLTTLEGLDAAHVQLATLDASNNHLVDASALDALPRLSTLKLGYNRLQTFPEAVRRVQNTAIHDNPGTPGLVAKQMHHERDEQRRVAEGELPKSHAPALPSRRRLQQHGVSRSAKWFGNRVQGEGRIARFEGAGSVVLAEVDPTAFHGAGRHPEPVRLEFEVAGGKARIYLAEGQKGYPFLEVEPGKTVVARGSLIASTTYTGFFVESIGGPVTDFRYRVQSL